MLISQAKLDHLDVWKTSQPIDVFQRFLYQLYLRLFSLKIVMNRFNFIIALFILSECVALKSNKLEV